MTFHVIGIGNKKPNLTDQQQQNILDTKTFSGGKRHYKLVKEYLPKNHRWIYIQSPMSAVFKEYEKAAEKIVVFASGNPLFYGFSNTLKNKYPDANIITEPYFSAIQLLTNTFNINNSHLQTVSVHGRSWEALDTVIIQQKEYIGILTDTKKTPATIATRLLEYGYDNYSLYIAEDIEGEEEKFHKMSLQEAVKMKFHPLNCLILKKISHRQISFGIKDKDFIGLPNRPKMITKMPIRLTTLHLLDIVNSGTFWDIGFCTGSVSIEAKLRNPDLDVIAFEKREECKTIIEENQKRFGIPGIKTVMGDFITQNLTQFPKPNTVFVGGHGGQLPELFHKIEPFLLSDTTIVINAVREDSIKTFKKECKKIGYAILEEYLVSLDDHNPITLLKAKRIDTSIIS